MVQSTRLKKLQQVKLKKGGTVTVIDKLGEGGQGTVYKVRNDQTGEDRALKWYFAEKIKNFGVFYDNLEKNAEAYDRSPSPAFVWPERLTENANGTFGYIMRVFPEGYKSFAKFITANVRFSSYDSMMNAAINIVTAFMDLHNAGYNYQDLNDGNFSINPLNGDVLICDNDNVMGHGQYSGVIGKARYMAPEIVRGETMPDKKTDRFSLAVILFLLLINNHPLEGKKTLVPALTSKYDRMFYGTKPVFIFDDTNDSNRPVPGLHKNAINYWPYLPTFMQDAFKKSFSQDSMLEAKGRLLELDWFHLLVRLKGSATKCPNCKELIFLENSAATVCPECKKIFSTAGYLNFLKKRSNIEIQVPVYEDVCLFDYHMRDGSKDFNTVAAKVLAKPGKFGLENRSQYNWVVTSASGKITEIKKGEGAVAVLGIGTTIDFGEGNVSKVISNS